MDFKDLLDYCKAEAIANTISTNEISVWRGLCRSYSQKFATPLHLCLDGTIDPEAIILAEFEDQLCGFKEEDHLESILDEIYALEDPEYEAEKRKDLEDFMEKAEREEAERLRLGKPIHRAMKEETTLQKGPIEEPKRTGGSINLSYLEKEEIGSGNFEE
jgi:hypothetical protein